MPDPEFAFFHHEHDDRGELREIREAVTALTRVVQNSSLELQQIVTEAFTSIHNTLGEIMSEQSHLDADVAGISAALADEIAALKAQPGAEVLNFSKLDDLLALAQANDPGPQPAPAPVDTPPAPTPAPVDTPPADTPPSDTPPVV